MHGKVEGLTGNLRGNLQSSATAGPSVTVCSLVSSTLIACSLSCWSRATSDDRPASAEALYEGRIAPHMIINHACHPIVRARARAGRRHSGLSKAASKSSTCVGLWTLGVFVSSASGDQFATGDTMLSRMAADCRGVVRDPMSLE